MHPFTSCSTNEHPNNFPFEVCNLLLGKGGSGQVFLGRTGDTGTYIAVKKRYVKYNSNDARLLNGRAIDSPGTEPIVAGRSKESLSSHISTLNAQLMYGGDQPPHGLEVLNYGCASQKREFDLGEESVSQTTALSQQQGNGAEDSLVKEREKSRTQHLSDEVSVLHYLGPHPQIVSFLGDYTTSRNVSFVTMELMDSDVGRELKEGNVMLCNENVCAAIGYSVLLALARMHECGVAHRDVKPGNILLRHFTEDTEKWSCTFLGSSFSAPAKASSELEFSGAPSAYGADTALAAENTSSHSTKGNRKLYVKAALGDFSAAQSFRSASDFTFSDNRGTLHYKSPEQLMGRRNSMSQNGSAGDLWGLGCTLFEMATGARPFPGTSELQVLMSILDSLGSDLQCFPTATKAVSLFHKAHVSSEFLDLLQHLLCLDPACRYTVSEAMSHSFFAAIRRCELSTASESNTKFSPVKPHIIGIPLSLKYVSPTDAPHLCFHRIARTPRKASPLIPGVRLLVDQDKAKNLPPPETLTVDELILQDASGSDSPGQAVRTATSIADSTRLENESSAVHWRHASHERGERMTLSDNTQQPQQLQPCLDATAISSFLSESSYLHWSEIRPVHRPSVPPLFHSSHQMQQNDGAPRSCSNSRTVTLFTSHAASNTPSPSANPYYPQQHMRSVSKCQASNFIDNNTVSRALDVSDSCVKIGGREGSASHVDFDLSPAPSDQHLGAGGGAQGCAAPHPIFSSKSRRSQPVLHLTSGSTFTAINLRANLSFERENLLLSCGGGAATAAPAAPTGHCCTPRWHGGSRPTAFADRALRFSEETDLLTRRSWGSSTGQRSYLNSLSASPAQVRGTAEGSSPQPSPIRPIGGPTRSPSGIQAAVDRSEFSWDDSGVGLGWIAASAKVAAPPEETEVSLLGAAVTQKYLSCENAGDTDRASMVPLPSVAHIPLSLSGGDATAIVEDAASAVACESRYAHLCTPRVGQPPPPPSGGYLHSRVRSSPTSRNDPSYSAVEVAVVVPSDTAPVTGAAGAPPECSPTHPLSSMAVDARIGAGEELVARTMPLPIPLSVATNCKSASPEQGSARSPPSSPRYKTLPGTPRAVRLSCLALSPIAQLQSGAPRRDFVNRTTDPAASTARMPSDDPSLTAGRVLQESSVNVPPAYMPHPANKVNFLASTDSPAAALWREFSQGMVPVSLQPSPSSQRHCTPSPAELGWGVAAERKGSSSSPLVKGVTVIWPTECSDLQLEGYPPPRLSVSLSAQPEGYPRSYEHSKTRSRRRRDDECGESRHSLSSQTEAEGSSLKRMREEIV